MLRTSYKQSNKLNPFSIPFIRKLLTPGPGNH